MSSEGLSTTRVERTQLPGLAGSGPMQNQTRPDSPQWDAVSTQRGATRVPLQLWNLPTARTWPGLRGTWVGPGVP